MGAAYLQIDDDADGIPNVADLCPNTDNTTVASEDGCGDGEERLNPMLTRMVWWTSGIFVMRHPSRKSLI